MAKRYDVGDYVDLTRPEKPELIEPSISEYSDVLVGATAISDLDANQKTELNMLTRRYCENGGLNNSLDLIWKGRSKFRLNCVVTLI